MSEPSPESKLPVVVVVDDEEHTVATFLRTLRKRAQVYGATSGEEALALVRRHDVALVISDQRMPGMSGVELMEQVRVLSPRTERVLLSGYSEAKDLIDAINRGAVSRYVLKPVTGEQLRALVDEHVAPAAVRPGTRVGVLTRGPLPGPCLEALAELRVELEPLAAEVAVDARCLADAELALVLADVTDAADDTAERVVAAGARVGIDVVLLVDGAVFYRAADLLRRGASDLVRLPADPSELYAAVARTLRRRSAERELARLREEAAPPGAIRDFVCGGRTMQRLVEAIRAVATTDSTVLLLGETGVGKEVVARAIHEASRRRKGALVPVHCAALTGTLLESELFGHEKGAFTGATERRLGRFERASGGTLFLDEVGDIPLDTQVKLLRVLQERTIERVGGAGPIPVDVRVVGATHRDLDAMVARGEFRQDLLYRLNVVPVRIPPLRERREEIRPLVEHFLAILQVRDGKTGITLGVDALARLEARPWPGNVRELRNVLERALAFTPSGKPVDPSLLEVPEVAPARPATDGAGGYVEDLDAIRSVHEAVDAYERHLLIRILTRHLWNQSQAAAQLGITRQSLARKLEKLGIGVPG